MLLQSVQQCGKPHQSSALERAPSPVLGHTADCLLGIAAWRDKTAFPARTIQWGGWVVLGWVALAVVAVLSFETTCSVPFLIMTMACIASAGGDAVRMKAGILVERNVEAAVLGTEDMATMATVVSSSEKIERIPTLGGVAIRRLLVRLVRRISLHSWVYI